MCKYTCTNDLHQLFKIAQFIAEIYGKASHQQVCTKYLDITGKLFQLTKIVYGSVGITLAICPMLYYWVFGNILPTLPIYFPDMNSETFCDFLIVYCVHSIMNLTASYIVYAFDTLTIVVFVNMSMVAALIAGDIKELQCALIQHRYSASETKLRLLKIILMHKIYNEWVISTFVRIWSWNLSDNLFLLYFKNAERSRVSQMLLRLRASVKLLRPQW